MYYDGRVFLIFFSFSYFFVKTEPDIQTVVLIPGGKQDVEDRSVGDYYQYGLTQQICQQITQHISTHHKQLKMPLKVITLRTKPIKSGNFFHAEQINKMNPTVAIHVGVYAQPLENLEIDIYCYNTLPNNTECLMHNKKNTLEFINVSHAHCNNKAVSTKMSGRFLNFFKTEEKNTFYKSSYFTIPFVPLKGIVCPAFGFEIGISDADKWKTAIPDICQAIVTMLEHNYT